MAEPSVQGRIHSVFRKTLPVDSQTPCSKKPQRNPCGFFGAPGTGALLEVQVLP